MCGWKSDLNMTTRHIFVVLKLSSIIRDVNFLFVTCVISVLHETGSTSTTKWPKVTLQLDEINIENEKCCESKNVPSRPLSFRKNKNTTINT